MTERVTYRGIIEAVVEAAQTHGMVKQVDTGLAPMVGQEYDINYPYVFVEIESRVNTVEASQRFEISYQVLDKIDDIKENHVSVLDRALLIAQEVYYALCNKLLPAFPQVSTEAEYSLLVRVYPDNVFGWRVETTLEAPLIVNVCNYPQ